MNKLLIFLILTTFVSCDNKKSHSEVSQEADKLVTKTEILENETNIDDKLKRHFELYRIKPSIEIINTEGNQTDIPLANHKIKWLNIDEETKIKIDNDLFSLKDKATLNVVWDNKDSVDFANNWDEIKLYKHKDKEYIGIRMTFAPCTGLGCGVKYFLIYDVATKSKNFFGTFRTNDDLELFDFSNDDKMDYLSKTYSGDANGSTPIEFIYELYSMDPII